MLWSRKNKEVSVVKAVKNSVPKSLQDSSIISFYAGWRPFLRIAFGGIIIIGCLFYYGIKTISVEIDQQKLSPVLQQLSDMAKNMFKDQPKIAALTNTAIREAGRLPITGTTGKFSSNAQILLFPTAKVVLNNELPSFANKGFSMLSCSQKQLHCRNRYYSIDTPFEADEAPKSDFAHAQVSKVFKTDSEKCTSLPLIIASQKNIMPETAIEEKAANWIAQGEMCRSFLERQLRTLENQLGTQLSKVEDFQEGITYIKLKNEDDETYKALKLSSAYNITLSAYTETISKHDTYCYISKVLGAAYLVASGDPLMSRNQNEAAVVISAALGLLSCDYKASNLRFKYEWPLLKKSDPNSEVDGAPYNTSEEFDYDIIKDSTKEWEKKGYEVMDITCEEVEGGSHECVKDETGFGNKHCYGIQMLRKKPSDGFYTIYFSNAVTQKIFTMILPKSAKFVDQSGIVNNENLLSLYCNQPPVFNNQGGLEIISLKYKINSEAETGRIYIRQNDPVKEEWSASKNPQFPSAESR